MTREATLDNRGFDEAVVGAGSVKEESHVVAPPSMLPSEGRKVLSYSCDKLERDWFLRCLVGRTVRSVVPSEVPSLLKAKGVLNVRTHVLGGDLVLLSPSEDEDIHVVLKNTCD
ncbi:unnamed protein product [Lupinus luteus]|uniref:Uncharacterized protein n=1 Tax=Lupinus luteus TaxID=3873 RepID=A0AAV1WRY5_LUPLU